ncbi:MAG: T9SS type A sorting domain-containing protein, partial [Bacteroidales bacterium]|nr:T9SS type A sorting domain-containing protein [Bacteroidales bacterium]
HASNLVTVEGCDSVITTTVNVNPVYDLTENVSVCSGESYTFPDGTLQDNITSSISHTSNLVSVDGCDSTIVTYLDIVSVDNTIIQNEVTLTANASGAGYEWVDCDNGYQPVEGENGQSFTLLQSGNYAVVVTENGCSSISDCYYVVISGVMENSLINNVDIYPNPVKDYATIRFPDFSSGVLISVFNLQGRNVLNKSVNEEKIIQLDMHDLESGIYIIHVKTDNENMIFRILKE